jgi:hypothetical protein
MNLDTALEDEPVARCSLFRRVAWRPRDAMAGVAIALLIAVIQPPRCNRFPGVAAARRRRENR